MPMLFAKILKYQILKNKLSTKTYFESNLIKKSLSEKGISLSKTKI